MEDREDDCRPEPWTRLGDMVVRGSLTESHDHPASSTKASTYDRVHCLVPSRACEEDPPRLRRGEVGLWRNLGKLTRLANASPAVPVVRRTIPPSPITSSGTFGWGNDPSYLPTRFKSDLGLRTTRRARAPRLTTRRDARGYQSREGPSAIRPGRRRGVQRNERLIGRHIGVIADFLTGEERWYCPKCRVRVDATKKINLFMLPPILIVHLKRSEFCSTSCQWTKIDRVARYPLSDWNLSASMTRSGGEGRSSTRGDDDDDGVYPLFDLYAISNHVGNVGHGHYTSHARNRFDGAWYNFNDGRCDRIINDPTMRREGRRSGERGCGGSSSSSSAAAYCLFYNRIERVPGANGKDGVHMKTIVRRQSVSRPKLWPHLQRSKAAEWASLRVGI
ncbi:hypothetical protein ACHAW5_007003 [Stephanodiscus triporus]|uniref:USP domain-containing protein n=1 Tax=Stephanodiscus triporus TaxID=2934178 RepID=A0ABD3MZF5_9STRA